MVLQFGGKFGNLGSHLREIIATGQQLGENLWILPGQIIEEKGRFSWGFFHVGFITIYNPIIINANWIEWEAYYECKCMFGFVCHSTNQKLLGMDQFSKV